MKKLFFFVILLAAMFGMVYSPMPIIFYAQYVPLDSMQRERLGVSDVQMKGIVKEYNKIHLKENMEIISILNYFQYNFDDEYYAGAYWDGDTLKQKCLYILVTDFSMIPNEMKHKNIYFREVKFNQTQLLNFMDIAGKAYTYDELSAVSNNTKQNSITVELIEGADPDKLSNLLPEGSYDYHFVKKHTVTFV